MEEQPAVVSKAFGEVLKETREADGQSQEELAERSKLNRTFISFLERGLRQPTLTTLFALARGLRTKASKLVHRADLRLRRYRRYFHSRKNDA